IVTWATIGCVSGAVRLKEVPERHFLAQRPYVAKLFLRIGVPGADGLPSVQRSWRGDIPAHRRKCRARWLWSEKPVARAISDNGACVSRSICSTCSKRRRNRYVCGGTPTD